MSFQAKRIEYSARIRKEEKESLFKKIRMSLLLKSNGEDEGKNLKQVTASGQYEIIESIQAFRKDQVPIMFEAVNEYILAFNGTFSEQFRVEVAKVVFESFRTNGHALASLAHLLFNCTQTSAFGQIDNFKEKIKLLIQDNLTKDGKGIENGEPLAFLLFSIFNLHETKEDLYFLPNYYQIFANSIGYFNLALLLMIQSASRIRYLLPPEHFLQSFLTRQLPYLELDPMRMMLICQFLQNYVCFNLSKDIYCRLAEWIYRRLKQRKFSVKLKQSLIKIITIAICYQQVMNYINSNEGDLKVFQDISAIARFGSQQSKEEALSCLICLAGKSNNSLLQYLVDYLYLLEIMIYALQFSKEIELTTKLLQSLASILNENQRYLQTAKNLNLKSHLYRLSESPNAKCNELAAIISGMFLET